MAEIKVASELKKVDIIRSPEKKLQNKLVQLAGEVTKQKSLRSEVAAPESNKLREIRSWIGEINPNYTPFSPAYGTNCGTCAWLVHNRFYKGLDLSAGKINIAPRNADMERLTGLKCENMSIKKIENTLRCMGPNSEMIVGIDRRSGPGHWFNVFYDGKNFYTIDGQCGKIMNWPNDYGDVCNWCALV